MLRPTALIFAFSLVCACKATPDQAGSPLVREATGPVIVQHWGGMRDVLRNGNTQGRVTLADVVGPNTIAVGALEGLGAEVTIMGGQVQLAVADATELSKGLRIRSHDSNDQATLLVLANVPQWEEHSLAPVSDVSALEVAIHDIALTQGLDVTQPFPFRIEGTATELHVHVLNHSCPIANPEGPAPWRFTGMNESIILVGFYAQDAAGTLTHHGQSSHIHAILEGGSVSGHLDGVKLENPTRLFLPAR